jgi:hypothetical protein
MTYQFTTRRFAASQVLAAGQPGSTRDEYGAVGYAYELDGHVLEDAGNGFFVSCTPGTAFIADCGAAYRTAMRYLNAAQVAGRFTNAGAVL